MNLTLAPGAMVPGSSIFPSLARSSSKREVELPPEEKRQRQHRPVAEHRLQQGVRQGEGGGVGGRDGEEGGGAWETFLPQARVPPTCLSVSGHLQGSTR